MKLRIQDGSLRLQLSQGEMRTLADSGEVADHVSFPGGMTLTYRLRMDRNITSISASYTSDLIDIRVPRELSERWCDSALLTLSASQPLAPGELQIVLEKDWASVAEAR